MEISKNEQKILKASKNAKFFKHLADPIAKEIVVDMDGNKLTGDSITNTSFQIATYMAIGAEEKRAGFMLAGGVIGAVGTVVTIKLYDKFKKRRNTDEEVVSE